MTGGIAGKIGNIYEAKGAILGLLRVLSGDALSIQYESNDPREHGVDWIIGHADHQEAVQSKQRTTSGNWTIKALEGEGVLQSAKAWLSTTKNNSFTFISDCSAPCLQSLCSETRCSATYTAFQSSLPLTKRNDFESLLALWKVSPDTAFDFLSRINTDHKTETTLGEFIQLRGSGIFDESNENIYALNRPGFTGDLFT